MRKISINDYLKKNSKRNLTVKQKEYLNNYFSCQDNNDNCLPLNLGKIDLRKRSKNQINTYYFILKSINDNFHCSHLMFNIEIETFNRYIDNLKEEGLITKIETYPKYQTESYIVTLKAEKLLENHLVKIKKLLISIFANSILS